MNARRLQTDLLARSDSRLPPPPTCLSHGCSCSLDNAKETKLIERFSADCSTVMAAYRTGGGRSVQRRGQQHSLCDCNRVLYAGDEGCRVCSGNARGVNAKHFKPGGRHKEGHSHVSYCCFVLPLGIVIGRCNINRTHSNTSRVQRPPSIVLRSAGERMVNA